MNLISFDSKISCITADMLLFNFTSSQPHFSVGHQTPNSGAPKRRLICFLRIPIHRGQQGGLGYLDLRIFGAWIKVPKIFSQMMGFSWWFTMVESIKNSLTQQIPRLAVSFWLIPQAKFLTFSLQQKWVATWTFQFGCHMVAKGCQNSLSPFQVIQAVTFLSPSWKSPKTLGFGHVNSASPKRSRQSAELPRFSGGFHWHVNLWLDSTCNVISSRAPGFVQLFTMSGMNLISMLLKHLFFFEKKNGKLKQTCANGMNFWQNSVVQLAVSEMMVVGFKR